MTTVVYRLLHLGVEYVYKSRVNVQRVLVSYVFLSDCLVDTQ